MASALPVDSPARLGPAMHALVALKAIVARELTKFVRQWSRLVSALVRPALWLIVVAAGFQNVLGVSIIAPYRTYITYQEYMLPGLLGMMLLFNGMQSSLSLVYDREMGMMRLLLTAPMPRWYVLFAKLLAGTLLSLAQAYAFLLVARLFNVQIPLGGWLTVLPALLVAGLMLGSIGLVLSVYIRQLENFAGTMNFVIFPMFFCSSALYPLWKLRESGASFLWWVAQANPFTHAVELIRFAAYGQFNAVALLVVLGVGIVSFLLAVFGYDPQRGQMMRKGRE
ncbi:ABC transporter permease [Devosia ginsengisoli]|uniref:ABC transporter permease n=1 Tax=Devosia ginsengisoli TaxID=400770 RepID=UPI0026F059F7|nr:ABC transporter permease [Devosia ginsengisoli]MCR6670162.1 ABC transporter permease [Devosia ginsengisoli]